MTTTTSLPRSDSGVDPVVSRRAHPRGVRRASKRTRPTAAPAAPSSPSCAATKSPRSSCPTSSASTRACSSASPRIPTRSCPEWRVATARRVGAAARQASVAAGLLVAVISGMLTTGAIWVVRVAPTYETAAVSAGARRGRSGTRSGVPQGRQRRADPSAAARRRGHRDLRADPVRCLSAPPRAGRRRERGDRPAPGRGARCRCVRGTLARLSGPRARRAAARARRCSAPARRVRGRCARRGAALRSDRGAAPRTARPERRAGRDGQPRGRRGGPDRLARGEPRRGSRTAGRRRGAARAAEAGRRNARPRLSARARRADRRFVLEPGAVRDDRARRGRSAERSLRSRRESAQRCRGGSESRLHERGRNASKPAPDSYRGLQHSLDQLGVDAARSVSTGAGVRVAVLDSAPQTDHPDLPPVRVAKIEGGPHERRRARHAHDRRDRRDRQQRVRHCRRGALRRRDRDSGVHAARRHAARFVRPVRPAARARSRVEGDAHRCSTCRSSVRPTRCSSAR